MTEPVTHSTSGTARRLFAAFALLVGTFAVASFVTFRQLDGIRARHAEMKQHEEGVRIALELASAVRDQYAHQAHTIILGNASHLHLYEEAEGRVKLLTGQVRAHAGQADEQAWVDDIERSTAELDVIFRQRIVPAVLRKDPAGIQDEHDRAQVVVTFIQDRADRLAHRFEASIATFREEVVELQAAAFRRTLFFLVVAPLLAVAVGAYVLRFAREHQERLVQSEKLAGIGRLAAGVAHEINNPLAVILGYAKLLRRRADEASARDLQVIEDETLRAKHIVDGLLELARPREAEPEPLDLRALCEDAVSRLREARAFDGVEVAVSGAAGVRGHPYKLRQVVLNLLRNAAEAAGAGGRVEVAVEGDGAGAIVTVRDSGPGLAEAARARLFEPFFTTKASGTGLGLAVSQGIVRAHGGSIEAGQAPGGGATFTVRLPATPPGRV